MPGAGGTGVRAIARRGAPRTAAGGAGAGTAAGRRGDRAAAGTRACGLLNTALDSLDDLWGHRTDAHDFVDQVISLSQNLRPCLDDNPELAQALLDLRSEALFLRIKLGDAIGPAVEFGESLRADCLRLHGGKHRQTLWAQNDLARAYQAAGRTDEAIALHEESLAVCTRKLGAAAPETMTARDELARAYQVAGRLDEPPGFTNKKWAGSRIPVRAVADVGGDPGLAGDRDQGRRESRLARLGAVDHRRQADDAGPHPAVRETDHVVLGVDPGPAATVSSSVLARSGTR